jgi:hypothetical protein
MKKITILLWTLLLVVGFSSQSWCLTYSATDILNHTTTGATVTQGTAALSLKTTPIIGTVGVGTKSGYVDGEIDNSAAGAISNEWIRITFDTPQFINDIKVAFLYPCGQYGDLVNEKAKILTNLDTQYLQATGFTSATWDGSGTVNNLEKAQDGYGGVWEISNPFIDAPISYIEFRAVKLGRGDSSDSDYSIVSISTSTPTVPEPVTMLLVGFGLTGLAGMRRFIK